MIGKTRRQHGSRWRFATLAALVAVAAVVVGLGLAAPLAGPMHFDTGASSGGAPDVRATLDACLGGGSACTVIFVVDGVRHTWVAAGAGSPPVAAGDDVLPCAASDDGAERAGASDTASVSSQAPRMVAALGY